MSTPDKGEALRGFRDRKIAASLKPYDTDTESGESVLAYGPAARICGGGLDRTGETSRGSAAPRWPDAEVGDGFQGGVSSSPGRRLRAYTMFPLRPRGTSLPANRTSPSVWLLSFVTAVCPWLRPIATVPILPLNKRFRLGSSAQAHRACARSTRTHLGRRWPRK